jgi:hypothetical protein
MKISTVLTSVLLASFSINAFSAQEFQFRVKLDGTNFASQYTPTDPKPPLEPSEPAKPEFDISPWQDIKTSFMLPTNTPYAIKAVKNCPYKPGLPDCIVSKNNDVVDISIVHNSIRVEISTAIEELKDHLDSITISTKNGTIKCSNIEYVGIIPSGTDLGCILDNEYDFTSYADGQRVNAVVSLNKK